MSKITISFRPSLNDVEANWRKLATTGIYESIARLGQESNEILLGAIITEAPVDTSKLRDELHAVQKPSGHGVSFDYRTVSYAQFVIQGTAAHVIEPVNATVLAFLGSDGKMVFTLHVNHPGTAPNDFPLRAWESARGDVLDVLARTGREILESVLL